MADNNLASKVLFLDIDGVLNSLRSCYAFKGYPHCFSAKDMAQFDHVAVSLIRRVCEETDASIVLSSTWRLMHTPHECANGLDLPIFDRTKQLNGPRGKEIAEWLSRHPEVTSYAIVDDDGDMLEEQRPYFVQTDGREGLSFSDFERLKEILGSVSVQLRLERAAAQRLEKVEASTDG